VPSSRDGGHGAGAVLGVGFADEEVDAGATGEVREEVAAGGDDAERVDDPAGVGEGAAVTEGVCIVAGAVVVVGPAAGVPDPGPQPISASRTAAVKTASERARARRTAPWSTHHGGCAMVEGPKSVATTWDRTRHRCRMSGGTDRRGGCRRT
jgi:hypothetical protein